MPRSHQELSKIDPNQVPSVLEPREVGYLNHPDAIRGKLRYDKHSLMLNFAPAGESPTITNDIPIQVVKGKWTGDPEAEVLVPEQFLERDQPKVGTCSKPVPGQNMGCFAHNGCPYPDPRDPRGRGPGRFNVIIEKDGYFYAVPCCHYYHGVRHGLPTAQVHYAYSGYRIAVDRTTVESTKTVKAKDGWGQDVWDEKAIEMQVETLGPMYAHHFGKHRREKPKPDRITRHDYQPPFDEAQLSAEETATPINEKPGRVENAPVLRDAPVLIDPKR